MTLHDTSRTVMPLAAMPLPVMPRPPGSPAFAGAGGSGHDEGGTDRDRGRPVMTEEVRPAARAQSGAQTAPAQSRARVRAQAGAIRAKQGPACRPDRRGRTERSGTERDGGTACGIRTDGDGAGGAADHDKT